MELFNFKNVYFFAGLTFYVEDSYIEQSVQDHSLFEQSEFEWPSFYAILMDQYKNAV